MALIYIILISYRILLVAIPICRVSIIPIGTRCREKYGIIYVDFILRPVEPAANAAWSSDFKCRMSSWSL